jgi:hypothetical protein
MKEVIKIDDDSPQTPVIKKRPYNLRSSSKSSPSPKEPQEKAEKGSSKKQKRDHGDKDHP